MLQNTRRGNVVKTMVFDARLLCHTPGNVASSVTLSQDTIVLGLGFLSVKWVEREQVDCDIICPNVVCS